MNSLWIGIGFSILASVVIFGFLILLAFYFYKQAQKEDKERLESLKKEQEEAIRTAQWASKIAYDIRDRHRQVYNHYKEKIISDIFNEYIIPKIQANAYRGHTSAIFLRVEINTIITYGCRGINIADALTEDIHETLRDLGYHVEGRYSLRVVPTRDNQYYLSGTIWW